VVLDGNDVLAVRETVGDAVDRARDGEGPALIEALTYRHFGHSRTDPATYRPADEVQAWLARDPLVVARERLAGLGIEPSATAAVDARVEHLVADAVAEAKAAPPPDAAQALTDVWADGSATWRN
jgi:TPP-dependent pyruvate/acetoin dehydrogenase alpha subunit